MNFSDGFLDSLFGEKITLELPDGNGGIIKREVTKKWFNKMVAEGKLSKAVCVNILNSIAGERKEEWMVNEHIDYDTYNRFIPDDDELFILEYYEGEEQKSMIVKREVYINALDEFKRIDTDSERHIKSELEAIHSNIAEDTITRYAAAIEEVQSDTHSENSIRARWLNRLEMLMKEYQNEAFAGRLHSLHGDFNAMIILHSVYYIRMLIQLLEIGSKMDQNFDEASILRIEQYLVNISKEQYRELTKYITSILIIEFLNDKISGQLFEMGIDEQDFKKDFFDGLQIDKKFIMTENIQSLQRKILATLDLPITEAYIVAADGATGDTYNQFNNDFVGWVEDKYLSDD